MPGYSNGAGYFLYVGNVSEVYNYSVPQGQTMYFMDKNNPIFYTKSVDMFNQQTVDAYDLVKRTVVEPQPADSEFIRRDELTAIISETIRNELRSQNYHRNKNRDKENN